MKFYHRKHPLTIVGMKLQATKEVRHLGLLRVPEFGMLPLRMRQHQEELVLRLLATRNQRDVIVGMKLRKLNVKLQATIVDGLKLLVQIEELGIRLWILLLDHQKDDPDGMRLHQMQLHP